MSLKPDIFQLSSTTVLVTNATSMSLKCPNRTIKLKGCKFCIQKVPCLCTLNVDKIVFHPRIINCQENLDVNDKVYPINLALLHSFFGFDKTRSIFGDSYFSQEANITVPDFKLYEHNFKEILVSDRSDHFSLKKMAKAARNDEKIFQNLAEPL